MAEKKILFITYDFHKDGYPEIPYSIATIWAAIKHHFDSSQVEVAHKSILLSELQRSSQSLENFKQLIAKENNLLATTVIDGYQYVAIGVNAWSEEYAQHLLQLLQELKYTGCIILGGYNITATDEDELDTMFPQAQYFIKGYAEEAIISILSGKEDRKVILGSKVLESLPSPYVLGIIQPDNKAYLETKRGCPYKCGFCEWGNLGKNKGKVIFYPLERIKKDIDVLNSFKVKEINVLDGTFNFGTKEDYNYVLILEKLIANTHAIITLQCRFENIKDDELSKRFLQICSTYQSRIKLEFGLQTIHEDEMKVIGRKNELDHVDKVLDELKKLKINYLVSIIFGIPGQTEETLVETVTWLLQRGCSTIAAYPLRIPRNSELFAIKKTLGVVEEPDSSNVLIVKETSTFDKESHVNMDTLSNLLFQIQKPADYIETELPLVFIIARRNSSYQYQITEITSKVEIFPNKGYLIWSINNFLQSTESEKMPEILERINKEMKTRKLPCAEIADLEALKRLYYSQIDDLTSVSTLFWRTIASSQIELEDALEIALKHEAFKWVLTDIIELLLNRGSWLFKSQYDSKPVSAMWRINERGFIVLEMNHFEGLDFINSAHL